MTEKNKEEALRQLEEQMLRYKEQMRQADEVMRVYEEQAQRVDEERREVEVERELEVLRRQELRTAQGSAEYHRELARRGEATRAKHAQSERNRRIGEVLGPLVFVALVAYSCASDAPVSDYCPNYGNPAAAQC